MKESLLSKIYKYRQSEKKHQKENYLTEIFAYCLESDKVFALKFLQTIGVSETPIDLSCKAQINSEFGRPDILIEINNVLTIAIESKIDSTLGPNQLIRYQNYLEKYGLEQQKLVFITKFYEDAGEITLSNNFISLRWFNIFQIIRDTKHLLTQELKNYLIEENMSSLVTFNKSDFSAIKSYNEVISKMNDFLERIKESLKENKFTDLKFLKEFKYGEYGIYTKISDLSIWVGFCQYEDDDTMKICISVEAPSDTKNDSKLNSLLKDKLKWESYLDDGKTIWYRERHLEEFYNGNQFDDTLAYKFLEDEIKNIKVLNAIR
jgi:hypothetical protein